MHFAFCILLPDFLSDIKTVGTPFVFTCKPKDPDALRPKMLSGLKSLIISEESDRLSSGYEDVTIKFREECKRLALGELIVHEEFTLHDSIAALEVMDPKMDNGIITEEEKMMHAYDVSQLLLPEEIVDIMDHLFASELSWHGGSSLSQTVFTCVYLQTVLAQTPNKFRYSRLDAADELLCGLLDLVLLPYIVGTAKCCFFIREEYLNGYLYDEEDVSTTDFGVDMFSSVSGESVSILLDDSVAWLERNQLALKAKFGQFDFSQLSERMKLRRAFLAVTQSMYSCKTLVSLVNQCSEHAQKIVPTLTPLSKLLRVFDSKIQRSLTSTAPPRSMMIMSVKEAYGEFNRLCTDLGRITHIDLSLQRSPVALFFYFDYLRKLRPIPLPLVRSLAQSILFRSEILLSPIRKHDFIVSSLQSVCGPNMHLFDPAFRSVELPSDRRHQIHRLLQQFFVRLEMPFMDLFRIFCHNPGRQRRNLVKVIADLEMLQAEAESLDEELAALTKEKPLRLAGGLQSHAFTISSWIFYLKMDCIIRLQFLGFGLDLYKPYEWPLIYWHLDYLLYVQNEHLTTILMNRLKPDSRPAKHVRHLMLQNEALAMACKAYFRLASALKMLGLIADPNLKFTSEESQYLHRMKPFMELGSPAPLPFLDYKRIASPGTMSPGEILRDAAVGFAQARLSFAALLKGGEDVEIHVLPEMVETFKKDTKQMVASCIASSLFVNMVIKEVDKGGLAGKALDAEYKYSFWFVQLSLRQDRHSFGQEGKAIGDKQDETDRNRSKGEEETIG